MACNHAEIEIVEKPQLEMSVEWRHKRMKLLNCQNTSEGGTSRMLC